MRGAPPWYSAACASYVSPQRAHARGDCFSLGTCSRVPSASATLFHPIGLMQKDCATIYNRLDARYDEGQSGVRSGLNSGAAVVG